MARGRRIVVLGMAGRLPFAGVAWQALHYLEGLRRLGHDVHYVEDTGDWPYDPERNAVTDRTGYTVRYVGRLMASIGLADRWAYRTPASAERLFGLSPSRLARVYRDADALVNLTGATLLRDEHRRVPVRVYLETDPVAPQIEVAEGRSFTIELLAAHTHYLTFGENLGAADCAVPTGCFAYRPTRQPVVLDWWEPRAGDTPPAPTRPFTTVASWQQTGKDVVWQGETYTWSKHHEFLKVLDLPGRTSQPLELALAGGDADTLALLGRHGWRTLDALRLTQHPDPSREYVRASRGEFTVAKDQNVRLRSGWFSDRSACYLAAGRPVVTQETGFSKMIPTGKGLFAFQTADQAVAALEEIASDYPRHSRAASEIAAECFSADGVLRRLCRDAGL
jgi:hypothetical protein